MTNYRYLTYTLSLKNVGRMYFLSSGVKGLMYSRQSTVTRSTAQPRLHALTKFPAVSFPVSCLPLAALAQLGAPTGNIPASSAQSNPQVSLVPGPAGCTVCRLA